MKHSLIRALWITALIVGGCAQSVCVGQTPPPKLSIKDLEKLKWIEGTWRGTGDAGSPFYERYHFENESTLVVDSLADEDLTKVDETTRFELKDGQFSNGGDGSRWAATSIDFTGVNFEPLANATNSIRWQRDSDNAWTAILKWPPVEGKPGRQRIYKMERWRK